MDPRLVEVAGKSGRERDDIHSQAMCSLVAVLERPPRAENNMHLGVHWRDIQGYIHAGTLRNFVGVS